MLDETPCYGYINFMLASAPFATLTTLLLDQLGSLALPGLALRAARLNKNYSNDIHLVL